MKSKKWIAMVVYGILLAGILTYGGNQYWNHAQKLSELSQEKQKTADAIENIKSGMASCGEQITVAEREIENLQTTVDGYEQTLSGIDTYAQQIEKVREQYSDLLEYEPLPLEYNFDKSVTEDNATYNEVLGTMTDILPNFFVKAIAACGEEQTNENTDIMVAINEEAQGQQFYMVQQLEDSVRNMNAHIDMYSTFVESQSVEEQFVNLQVLSQITKDTPIDGQLLEQDKMELLEWMIEYYYVQKSLHSMYEFVLTDNAENRAFLQRMESEMTELQTIFVNNGVNYDLDPNWYYVILEVQQTIKNVVDKIESKSAILPSIPIANHTYTNFSGDHNVARVYHYYKSMENGKKLVCAFDNNLWDRNRGSCYFIYDLSGEPIYVGVPNGYVYFFEGNVLETTTDMDTNMIYEEACWFYENMDGMTDDEYFNHTLIGR